MISKMWQSLVNMRRRQVRHRPAARLLVESLEDRCVPATLVVSSLADAGAGSLRAAITQANHNAGADVIVFAPELARGVIRLESGLPAITDALAINGPGRGSRSITLDGQQNGRVVEVAESAVQVTLRNLTITGGNVDDGGGLLNAGADTTLARVAVVRNLSGDDGGGIQNSGTLALRRCLVADNRAASDGGGIDNSGGTLEVFRSRLLRNSTVASDTLGGAVVTRTSASTFISDTTVADNRAGAGAGLGVRTSGSLVLLRSVLFGNRAIGSGGGVRAESGGSAFILNTTIAFNHSAGGKGGGGVSIDANAGQIEILNATIVANVDTAGNFNAGGGGIGKEDGSSTLRLFNSVVSGNIVAGGFVDLSNDDIDQGGNNFVVGDPRLGPLKANGGPTFTMAPLADSPLIDAGDTMQIADTTIDQRGLPRVVDGDGDGTAVVDIGAVEFARRRLG